MLPARDSADRKRCNAATAARHVRCYRERVATCPRVWYHAAMGIPGLLKQVGPLLTRENLYAIARGRTVGVDGHVWLHQLAYGFAQCIVVEKNYQPLARQFLQQALTAQSHGVTMVFVFDGAPTPAKRETDQSRQVRRAKAVAKLQLGLDPDPKVLRAAVALGWAAVEAVIRLLRQYGIPYLVAPYEADAQLALLCRESLVWGVTTVDSDFIVHGMANIFFKVQWRTGRCHMYRRSLLENPASWPVTAEVQQSPLLQIVRSAGLEVLLCFGLLVGCDYGTKIKGVGGKKAVRILQDLSEAFGVGVLACASSALDRLEDILADGRAPGTSQAVFMS